MSFYSTSSPLHHPDHCLRVPMPPVGVATPRRFSSAAIPLADSPAPCSSLSIGASSIARSTACALQAAPYWHPIAQQNLARALAEPLVPRERVPLDWARTQMNLGNALQTLGGRESGTERLHEAVQAYRAALQEYTRERVPLDWARTQMNLGIALWTLGERESGTERLHEAVQAYRAALQERTRERVPLQWALTIGNQGVALASIAERRSDLATSEQALSQITAAFETFREAGHAPYAAYYAE